MLGIEVSFTIDELYPFTRRLSIEIKLFASKSGEISGPYISKIWIFYIIYLQSFPMKCIV